MLALQKTEITMKTIELIGIKYDRYDKKHQCQTQNSNEETTTSAEIKKLLHYLKTNSVDSKQKHI